MSIYERITLNVDSSDGDDTHRYVKRCIMYIYDCKLNKCFVFFIALLYVTIMCNRVAATVYARRCLLVCVHTVHVSMRICECESVANGSIFFFVNFDKMNTKNRFAMLSAYLHFYYRFITIISIHDFFPTLLHSNSINTLFSSSSFFTSLTSAVAHMTT